jgi:uncharacterized SAM-binding protein YcdF (DUF218 family)
MSYIEPALPLFLLLGLIGLIRAWRASNKENRPWLLTISIVAMTLLSLNVTAWLFSRPLEMWYSQEPIPHGDADAIVVLAGTVNIPRADTPYAFAAQDTYVRLQRALWLFKNWRPMPILLCAGGTHGELYAQTMRHVLESEGVPPDMIWAESLSRNTHENAVYGSEILRKHGVQKIALVVEANSLMRASASFRKLGINVLPIPARSTHLNHELTDFFPHWDAIANNADTLHEMVGIAWYWLHGWI